MLVLSRKKGESIIIGDHIEITLVSVDADTVRIGITAPKEIDILRKELYQAIKESNVEAVENQLDFSEFSKKIKKLKKS
ncbi:carbon storage regulator CsrA [Paenibacillus sp. CGMCC 1.16610]|uniref:Translational regulator CsrA n=1 Tax=Paenibacillus anseongense TaxID=2682845 RepID=A0ABW9U323_9BACL|nr:MULTISPECIES: carbon storage regulator CsrA [Paenibacillus]MBA2942407.1 carbon storage regulator CsrA [Paenibacillus sp. CGMCC 1.16610]MVQ34482.1 carbon storage regulator CsrA [Paenibacillus anseongense]